MIQRDQGFVRLAHSTQTLGRRVFDEQRAFRRANPGWRAILGWEPAALAGMPLVRQGNRLSVMPVTPAQWDFILSLE